MDDVEGVVGVGEGEAVADVECSSPVPVTRGSATAAAARTSGRLSMPVDADEPALGPTAFDEGQRDVGSAGADVQDGQGRRCPVPVRRRRMSSAVCRPAAD